MSQIYCLVVLEVRNEMGVTGLKSRHQQGWAPSGGSRGEPLSLSHGGLPAIAITPTSASFFLDSFQDYCDYAGATQVLQHEHPILRSLTDSHLQSPFAMEGNRATSSRNSDMNLTFGGPIFCYRTIQLQRYNL